MTETAICAKCLLTSTNPWGNEALEDCQACLGFQALQAHIDLSSEMGSWSHDPSSLRMMMKTAFSSSCAKLRREGESAFDQVLDGIQDILDEHRANLAGIGLCMQFVG